MKTADHIEICQKIITTFGESAQIEMIIEECSELIQALQKLKRAQTNHNSEEPFYKSRLKNVHEEIADVSIMLIQAGLIFDSTEIDKTIDEKFNRIIGCLRN